MILIPTLYLIFDRIENSFKKKIRKILKKDSNDSDYNGNNKLKINFKNIIKNGKEKLKK